MRISGQRITRCTHIGAKDAQDIDHDLLMRLQCLYGVPNGLILCISHVAAMIRDAATASDDREQELKKLQYMATYLRNLADFIAPTSASDPTNGSARKAKKSQLPEQYKGLDHNAPNTWEPLVRDLIAATQRGLRSDVATPFEDRDEEGRIHLRFTTPPPTNRDDVVISKRKSTKSPVAQPHGSANGKARADRR